MSLHLKYPNFQNLYSSLTKSPFRYKYPAIFVFARKCKLSHNYDAYNMHQLTQLTVSQEEVTWLDGCRASTVYISLRANVVVDVINGCKQRAKSSLHNAMSYLFLRVHSELQPRYLLRCILNAFLQITKDNCCKSIRPSLYDHGSCLIDPISKTPRKWRNHRERIV